MGMGNAYTAVANDEDSVFYNPAGLAQIRRMRFNFINPKLEASKDDYSSVQDIGDAAEQFDASAVSKLFGKNIYANGSMFPNIAFPHFLLGFIYQGEFHLQARNKAMPRVETRYLLDRGLVGGFAFELRGLSRRHFLRLGTSVKWITRRGFDTTIPLAKLMAADKSYFKSLLKGPASGVGLNVGLQYDIPIALTDDLIIGSAWQDVGDTDFASRVNGDGPPKIRNNLSAGLGWIHRFSKKSTAMQNIKVTAEARHLTEENRDPRLKAHLGMELDLDSIFLRFGMNDLAYTAGVGLDMWLIRVAAATYAVETQTLAGMDKERRFALQLEFGFDLARKTSRTGRQEDRYRRPRQ